MWRLASHTLGSTTHNVELASHTRQEAPHKRGQTTRNRQEALHRQPGSVFTEPWGSPHGLASDAQEGHMLRFPILKHLYTLKMLHSRVCEANSKLCEANSKLCEANSKLCEANSKLRETCWRLCETSRCTDQAWRQAVRNGQKSGERLQQNAQSLRHSIP